MRHYWNEIDPYAAAWLRNLIDAGELPPGDVDERSIKDVTPDDVRGYVQCHWFAGIGGWSLALRLAGWPADRECWTGSCPCQPFSSAGKRKGKEDDRHLWPDWFRLIRKVKPKVVWAEQVASAEVVGSELEAAFVIAVQGGDYAKANKLAKRLVASKSFHFHSRWLDGVRTDLEAEDYAFRCAVLGAHSANAPHIRQRVFWLANDKSQRFDGLKGTTESNGRGLPEAGSRDCGLAVFDGGLASDGRIQRGGKHGCEPQDGRTSERLEHATGHGRRKRRSEPERWGTASGCSEGNGGGNRSGLVFADLAGLEGHAGHGDDGDKPGRINTGETGHATETSSNSGFWSRFDLIPCRDGKARRIEPGLEPLAHGVSGRVGLLRGYGNAIVPQAAEAFIRSYLEVT